MKEVDAISTHDEEAMEYDRHAGDYQWYAPEVLFGLCWQYVRPEGRLIDIGIGSGLSAAPYAQAGLEISGLDGSEAMLRVCRSKNIARELKRHDINRLPWPCADSSFDYVVSCGVFHFFSELSPLFTEVSRIIKNEGFFTFTAADMPEENGEAGNPKDYTKYITKEGVAIYRHGSVYIDSLCSENGFELLKKLTFLVVIGQENLGRMAFTGYLVGKRG